MRPKCSIVILWNVVVLGGAFAAGAEPLAAGKASEEKAARAAAIRQTLDAINQELKDHGGAWEAWAASLTPFRAELSKPGNKAGKRGFAFDGSDVRMLTVDKVEDLPCGRRPQESMVHLSRQLQARGIDLMVVFIPDKLATYPDYLVENAPKDGQVAVQMRRFMKELLENDVEVVDLYPAYRKFRQEKQDKAQLFYPRDRHWRNAGAQVAAEQIAEHLKRYSFVRNALAQGNRYTGKAARRTDSKKADDILQVFDRDGKAYRDVPDSPVLLTGDSYSKYNWAPGTEEPTAHLSAQVALRVAMPLSYWNHEGSWDQLPQVLAQEQQEWGLNGRRVI
ncbi:MAG: hypothetical protein ABR915_04760, partial [Thermoguttaceae bacterium]